jgi:ABC-type polysaccharide/polyol phosphate export permease
MTDYVVPDQPSPDIRFSRRVGLREGSSRLWAARELIRSLAERDLRARYKQTALGFLWAFVQPLSLLLVFTVFFRRVATVHSGQVPYALFSFVALVPWSFFSSAVSDGSLTLVMNGALITKVACPREVFPIAKVAVALLDGAIAAIALPILMVATGTSTSFTALWAVPLILLEVSFAAAVASVLAAVVVHLRDLRHAIPVLLQVGLFATPVAYGLEAIPRRLRGVYCAVNPLGAIFDGLRRSILYGHAPEGRQLLIATAVTAVWVLGGFRVFKRMETGIADLI